MAYRYIERLEDYESAFPDGVFVPAEVRNFGVDGHAVTEELFAVPEDSDHEGRYRMVLDLVPMEQVGLEIEVDEGTDDWEPRGLIPYGETPSAGQVAVSFVDGVVEFHGDDAGLPVRAAYTGRGTALMASWLIALQKEIAAVQAEGGGIETPGTTVVDGVPLWADTTGGGLKNSGAKMATSGWTAASIGILEVLEDGTIRRRTTAIGAPLIEEADTLATVTARGDSTPTRCRFTGGTTTQPALESYATGAAGGTRVAHRFTGDRDGGEVNTWDVLVFGSTFGGGAAYTLTLPTTSGTFAVGATSPLALNATTGVLTLGTVPVASGGTGATDAAGARSNLGLGTVAVESTVPVAKGGTGSTTASGARTNLGLGSIATQAASSVAVTGGTINGTTVGATTAASVRGSVVSSTEAMWIDLPAGAVSPFTDYVNRAFDEPSVTYLAALAATPSQCRGYFLVPAKPGDVIDRIRMRFRVNGGVDNGMKLALVTRSELADDDLDWTVVGTEQTQTGSADYQFLEYTLPSPVTVAVGQVLMLRATAVFVDDEVWLLSVGYRTSSRRL